MRSPAMVLEELRRISEPYIYAGDDNIFYDYHHASELCRQIEASGLRKQYYVLSRVDDIVRHPELIERWASVGLKKVFLGLESPRDEELRRLNKSVSVAKNNRALEILRANHIDPLGAFIVQPDYTRADFDQLLRYMDRMKIFYHEFTILTPFPGTAFYDQVESQVQLHDRRIFDLAHAVLPTALSPEEFYRLYSRLYRKANSFRRAARIRPNVSPFKRMRFVRLLPGMFTLFRDSRRAYRLLRKSSGQAS